MKNLLSALLLSVILFTATAAHAGETADINHRGWFHHERIKDAITPAHWASRTTSCKPCESLLHQYNSLGRDLMDIRYRIAYNDHLIRNSEKALGKKLREKNPAGNVDITDNNRSELDSYDDPVKAMGNMADFESTMQEANESLRALEQRVLADLHRLIPEIENCEKQCMEEKPNGKYSGITQGDIEIQGLRAEPGPAPALPFPWTGPYPDVCHKCAKLAARLNELPAMARERQEAIESMRRRLEMYNLYQRSRERYSLQFSHDTMTEDMAEDFGATDTRFNPQRLERGIEKLEGELEKITENFNATLRLYNECVPTCQQQQGPREQGALPGNGQKSSCPKPKATQPINVGKASEVGSTGKTKSDMKNKAIGMIMGGAGGGFSMGGGGGFGGGMESMVPGPMSGGGEKPKTEKDPVKKKVTAEAPGGTKLAVGAVMRDGKLLVSSSIKDSPGKGTFQTVFIENQDGQRMEPIAYYIYELWLNWTLNVWWTHDRWVDGQHVLHEEGEWTEKGKEKVGSGILPIYQKGKEKLAAVWNRLGFSHAVEGIKGLGTAFPVDLTKSGPVSVVIHTTLPKQDPVMTDPFVFTLSDDGKGGVTVEAAKTTLACP